MRYDLPRSSPFRLVPACALAFAIAGCAAPERAAESDAQRRGSPALEASVAAVPASAPRADEAQGAWTGEQLALWRSPDFQRRMVESFLSETEIEPRVTEDEREELTAILELMGENKIDAALQRLEKGRGPAASAVFDFTLGGLRLQREELDAAAEALEVAVAKHPKYRRAWQSLGVVHVRQGEHAEAARALTRVVEQGGGDALTYGLLGYSHSNLENFLSAESAYRMATLLDPHTQDWKTGLARCFFKQERWPEAIALTGSMIAERPERADLWLLQANAFLGQGDTARAAENFELVDRLGGSTLDSLNLLGDIYANGESYELARDAYARALELDPQAGLERALRAAKVLSSRGALEETAELIAAIEAEAGDGLSEPQRKDLLKLEARLAVARGAGGEEARILEEIVALDPLDGDALILLGRHSERQEDQEKAIFYYERAAGIEGFEAPAKRAHAQVLVRRGDYGAALKLLRRAQTLEPQEHVQDYIEQVERLSQSR